MILVTGAGGKTGQAVLKALPSQGEAVRALVRREDQVFFARQLGANEAVIADLLEPAEMIGAMAGVRAVYLIAPNVHSEETRIGEVAIAAARHVGVDRIVYHSVLHPQTRAMPHHWQKLAVEGKLFEAELDFTILQPAAYMQNVLPYWDEIVEQGLYRVPYGEGAALSLVDLEDIAEVAAKVLTSPEHNGATYELAGPEVLSPRRIAEVLSHQLGREVQSEVISLGTWAEEARASGLGGYQLDSLSRMFEYYDRHGLRGSSNVLQWLLGRSPTRFAQFAQRRSASRNSL
jgi:NAD(P)H dehydrogenase (quinone)